MWDIVKSLPRTNWHKSKFLEVEMVVKSSVVESMYVEERNIIPYYLYTI